MENLNTCMTYNTFTNRLKKLDLNIKQFSKLSSLPYKTIMNWKGNDKTPSWVDSWLNNYEAKIELGSIKSFFKRLL